MDIRGFFNDIVNVFTNGEPLSIEALGHDVGEYGEYASDRVLNNKALTDKSYIRTIKNVYIEKNGFTTEIDLIALTEKGIFVVESKNYGGWIFGSADNQKWTQCFKTGEKHQFYNPIKQNEGHRSKLASFLNISTNCVFSYIVFSDRCTLKEVPNDTEHIKVIKRNQLLWRMRDEIDCGRTFFTREEIDAMYERLLPLTQKTQEEKQAHVESVRGFKEGTICPLCKKQLVLRHGKYGDFYGCTGYPSCKFTRQV